MKKTIALFLFFIPLFAHAQKQKQPRFDMADFNQKAELAKWLYMYDAIAWWTSDSVMTYSEDETGRLGPEWFCFQDDKGFWHALYGKLENDRYDQIFHFALDSQLRISRTYEPVDTTLANGYARALSLTVPKMHLVRSAGKLTFNSYIRKGTDNTYTIWYFPAFQKDNTAVYGGEYTFTVDASARHILVEDKKELDSFRGFKVDTPREIHLDYTKYDKPTLGGIFFVWYYKKYFTNIYLETANSNSTVFKEVNSGSYYWVNVDKTGMKKGKKQKQ